ncbi:CBS domain-containing protein [Rhodohalobacter sp.]|uniref:CBS domain-containing protein n=1 Tax=Rhodohalobacter sp. TaxID=1974210 RepID=UPI002ACD857F|nr:CBS domain-containing protein [Rhodohalobacter sp.]MDZ7758169.1 CBS domain-containing protein [Rhodohalobacter sp.]
MLARELLNTEFTPLAPQDRISAALAKMDAWQTTRIPVREVTTGKLVGMISFEDIADIPDDSQEVNTVELNSSIYVYSGQHLFEVARKMLEFEVRLLPVVDMDGIYLGIVEKKDVLEAFSKMLNITTTGSVITVEVTKEDFTISELVHLIETEGAKILGLTVDQPLDDTLRLRISIKISHIDTSAVVSSLQRHGYHTTTENRNDLFQTDISSRADELLRYLDV